MGKQLNDRYTSYISSKKELIEKYMKGELEDCFSVSESAFSGIVIIDFVYGTEDKVFGYTFWQDSKGQVVKSFFLRKVYEAESKSYFKIGTNKYILEDFMRV